jgi:hypothetical protein
MNPSNHPNHQMKPKRGVQRTGRLPSDAAPAGDTCTPKYPTGVRRGANPRHSTTTIKSPPRKRGAQPGNTNALKLGIYSTRKRNPYRFTHDFIQDTRQELHSGSSPKEIIDRARLSKAELLPRMLASPQVLLTASPLDVSLTRLITRAGSRLAPALRRRKMLSLLAVDPFIWFHLACRLDHLPRDADTYTAVNEELPHYPPLPPDHPSLATNLTDEQWAVLAPLIPPDPPLDHPGGDPPVIIAANRWSFTRYAHISPARDRQVGLPPE